MWILVAVAAHAVKTVVLPIFIATVIIGALRNSKSTKYPRAKLVLLWIARGVIVLAIAYLVYWIFRAVTTQSIG
jgi:hypothetical protein